jgi:predicted RNA-binding Zn-ribbon protein involved in translation (DUF1610 family)
MSVLKCLYEQATEEDIKECGLLKNPYTEFCDRCGKYIFRCTACGVLTLNNMTCPQCGEPVEPNGSPEGEGQSAVPATAAQQTPASHATEFMAMPGSRLFFRHSDGWQIELADGDILGRVNGRFADRLGSAKFVSGTHAIITRGEDGWYFADQGSTNKSWVNEKVSPPNTPLRIKQNDVVTLANQKFTVTEL